MTDLKISPVQTKNQKTKNSSTARKAMALAGASYSLFNVLNGYDEFFINPREQFEEASNAYKRLPKEFQELTSLEKFSSKYIKDLKINKLITLASAVGFIMTTALAIGYIADKCIDAVRNHKSSKKAAQEISQNKQTTEETK